MEGSNPGRYDVVIVGGGSTGLSAALILGRCCWSVLVVDAGEPRNRSSPRLHGFVTRDGTPPVELLKMAREELRAYPQVTVRGGKVSTISRLGDRFQVSIAGEGQPVEGRRLLLATGLVDELPPVEGAAEWYGRGVYPCPICNGWEVRDQPIAVYATDLEGAELATEMLVWSRDLVLCTDGSQGIPADYLRRLETQGGVKIVPDKITRFVGAEGHLETIKFAGGHAIPCRALFFVPRQHQQTSLAESLGCEFAVDGTVRKRGAGEATNVQGVYVAGNSSACGGAQLVAVAAGQGAGAGHAIHCSLASEAFERGRWIPAVTGLPLSAPASRATPAPDCAR